MCLETAFAVDLQRIEFGAQHGGAVCAWVSALANIVSCGIMVNNPSVETLPSPVGTSGRAEASEDDEDITMETDPGGRYPAVHS